MNARYAVIATISLVAGLLAPGFSPAGAEPAAGTAAHVRQVKDTVRIFDQNMEGAAGSGHQLSQIEASIASFHPDVVMLVEICYNQVAKFKRDNGGRFSKWATHYTKMSNNSGCHQSGRSTSKGEMVASPHRLTNVSRYSLPGYLKHDPNKKPARAFHLTCADVSLPGAVSYAVRACATHLRSGYETKYRTEERTAQDNAIQSITQPWIDRGEKVIVAGDFNAKPSDPTLDAMYALSRDGSFTGQGSFVEAGQTDGSEFGTDSQCNSNTHCRTGEPTIGAFSHCSNVDKGKLKKYDYVFISRSSNYRLHETALPCNGSDHLAVEARATLPLPAS